MTNTINNIDEILNSESFNTMFDFNAEITELNAVGWNYEMTAQFAKGMSKQL